MSERSPAEIPKPQTPKSGKRQRVRFGRPPSTPVQDAETVIVGIGGQPAKKAVSAKPPAQPAPSAPPQLPEAA